MRDRDRVRFAEIIRQARAEGLSLTAAIERAYTWLLKPSKAVWP